VVTERVSINRTASAFTSSDVSSIILVKIAASGGVRAKYSKISWPSVATLWFDPVLTASVKLPTGNQWPGLVCAIANARKEPGTSERNVSSNGVETNPRF